MCGLTHRAALAFPQLERQYETLIKTVRGLEGELADYNLAMDKSRTSTVRFLLFKLNASASNSWAVDVYPVASCAPLRTLETSHSTTLH